MGETLLILAIVAVVLLGAILVFAATKPDTFRIERATSIQAAPGKVFPLINDFHSWGEWSPWEKIDPELKRTYSGAAAGPGAVYEWQGNKKVGQGRMEIMESTPASRIVIKLDFLKPFEAHHTAEFTLTGHGDSTNVNWAMHGRQPYMFKVMTMFFSMDKMVGKDFEAGLANMKRIAEM